MARRILALRKSTPAHPSPIDQNGVTISDEREARGGYSGGRTVSKMARYFFQKRRTE